MRIVHVLIIALALMRLASADNFTFTINPSTETASVSDVDKSCLSLANCSGGAISFVCGGPGAENLQPTFCVLQYNREEYITDPAAGCDPSNISLPLCPNDGGPFFGRVDVLDRAGDVEGQFGLGAFSHSLAYAYFYYDLDLIPFTPLIGPSDANIVDNGKVQFLDAMNWTDGEVDTFQVQFVPEASSVGLLSLVVLICGLLRWRDLLSGLRTLGLMF
jgi:hypothetical protein